MARHKDVFIVSAVRSPVGKAPRGVFATTRPDDLLAHVIKAAVDKAHIEPELYEDAIIGCAMPEGEQGMNIARIGVLLAGMPDSVAGMTVNRFCSSGLQAIALAAQQIQLGYADVMLAGGVESMSMVPMGGNKLTFNPRIFQENEHLAIAYGMGITAERVAQKWEISREAQDQFAYESHHKAILAQEKGLFKEEIVPYPLHIQTPDLKLGQIKQLDKMVTQDEGPRKDTNVEKLSGLPTVFSAKGTVTAGNSSQMSDGAAALVLASEQMVTTHNLKPLACFRSFNVAGVPPEYMGIGPVHAVPKALKMAGLTMDQINHIELNEAFAAQALAVIKELKLDPSKVNPQGGAIALGHPLGATGAIRAATIIHALRRTHQKFGLVTMCIGTGMGAAGVFEVL